MVSTKRKIVRNTIANSLLKISKYVINFLLFPFIVYYVGAEDYGIYLLVGAFVGYFGLLDLGVGSALIKYVAQYNAKEDKETVNEMVNSTFIFYLSVGIIIAFSIFLIGTFYVDVFNIDPDQIEKARLIAYITAIGALTSWPMRSFGTVLQGLQRYDYNAVIQFVVALINAGVTVILLLSGYGIIELILAGIIVGSLGQIITVVMVQKLLPYLEVRRKYMGFKTMKKIFKFSSVVFMSQIIILIVLGTDRIVIGAFVSVGAITYYTVARKLHDLINTASSLPSSALLPAATELETKRNHKALESLVFRGGKYKAALIIGTATIIIILAEPIIRIWMGENYIEMTFPTQVYVSYWFVFAAWGVLGSVLLAQEKYRPLLVLYGISAGVNIILSLVLVQEYGVLGVVMGTAIPYFFLMPIIIPYGLKLIGISFRKYMRRVVLPTYPLAFITGAFLLIIINFFPDITTNMFTLGILALTGYAIYFGLFYSWSLSRNEKKDIKKLLRMR